MHGQVLFTALFFINVLYIALFIYFVTNPFVEYSYIISLVIIKYIMESLTTWQAWSKVNLRGRMYYHGLFFFWLKSWTYINWDASQGLSVCWVWNFPVTYLPIWLRLRKLKIAATTSNTYWSNFPTWWLKFSMRFVCLCY